MVLLVLAMPRSEEILAEDTLTVLDSPATPVRVLQRWLRPQVHAALDRRLERIENLVDPAAIREYQSGLRDKLWESLGGRFDQTDLRPRVVGALDGEGYRVEKIVFSSQEGFYVTAVLFLPRTPPPYPAVLIPCGHTENGKAGYQAIAIALARHGMAAFCYDPIGQGERKQLLHQQADLAVVKGRYRATIEHNYDGIGPILLGKNLATYRVWDGIRSIDYLASRNDIDATRIGCTGNSGGGLMTSYLMALEPRIMAAAPGCFITTTRIKNERPGPGDAEQNIFGQIQYGLDHADYAILHAPRPVLILAATRDFVPIEGAWISFRQSKRIYGRLGVSECIDLVEADEKHGFTKPLRVAAVRWFRRWLLGRDDAVGEQPWTPHRDEDLQCTPQGQVLALDGARSLFELQREAAARLQQTREPQWRERTISEQRRQVKHVVGMQADMGDGKPAELRGNVRRQGYTIQRLRITADDGFELPALHFLPDKKDADAVPLLWLQPEGKAAAANVGGALEAYVLAGREVLAIDVRGYGETATTPWRFSGKAFGNNSAEHFISYMLGKSLVGFRASDCLVGARTLRKRTGKRAVDLVAVGDLGVPALHAVAVQAKWFRRVELQRCLRSWHEVLRDPVMDGQLENTVHGVLKFYDLPDLLRLATSQGVEVHYDKNLELQR